MWYSFHPSIVQRRSASRSFRSPLRPLTASSVIRFCDSSGPRDARALEIASFKVGLPDTIAEGHWEGLPRLREGAILHSPELDSFWLSVAFNYVLTSSGCSAFDVSRVWFNTTQLIWFTFSFTEDSLFYLHIVEWSFYADCILIECFFLKF